MKLFPGSDTYWDLKLCSVWESSKTLLDLVVVPLGVVALVPPWRTYYAIQTYRKEKSYGTFRGPDKWMNDS